VTRAAPQPPPTPLRTARPHSRHLIAVIYFHVYSSSLLPPPAARRRPSGTWSPGIHVPNPLHLVRCNPLALVRCPETARGRVPNPIIPFPLDSSNYTPNAFYPVPPQGALLGETSSLTTLIPHFLLPALLPTSLIPSNIPSCSLPTSSLARPRVLDFLSVCTEHYSLGQSVKGGSQGFLLFSVSRQCLFCFSPASPQNAMPREPPPADPPHTSQDPFEISPVAPLSPRTLPAFCR
jgi:hypothetical protein